jgi:hypothetical protein
MINLVFADLIVVIHFGFILFVIFGGFLVLKYHKLIWLHLPAVLWGALIEFLGWFCPLTNYENSMRKASGGGYASGFIEHYLIPMIYPSGLTREIQFGLGSIVIAVNLCIYIKLYLIRNENE